MRVVFIAKNEEEALVLLEARALREAVDTWYDECFRVYFKYKEITDDQHNILCEVRDKLYHHFHQFYRTED